MKKLLTRMMLLLCALMAGSIQGWADTYTHTFVKADFTNLLSSDQELSDDTDSSMKLTWSLTAKNANNANVAINQLDTNRGVQIGSGKSGSSCKTLTLSTSGISGIITKVVLVGGLAKSGSGSINCQVNEAAYGTSASLVASGSEAGTYTFEGSATGTILITMTQPSTDKAMYVKSVSITYSTGDSGEETVSVTGVNLDESTLSLSVGDEQLLTATVLPTNATNKNVTWSTSDADVATVENGTVTAVGAGTATITVTTADGSKTATCAVTVSGGGSSSGSSDAAVTFDFSTDIFELGTTKTVDEKSFTYNGYTITLTGTTGNGYRWYSDGYVILGQSGATLTFPAFPFNVSKIKIYGRSGASGKVTQNIFVGETAVSTETKGMTSDQEYVIADDYQTAGTIYTLKVTSAANTQFTKIEIYGYENVEVTDAGYATFASDNALSYTGVSGLTAYTAAVSGNKVSFTEAGQVPANEGVLVKADKGIYKVPVIAEASAISNDFIRGTGDAVASEDGGKYNYILNKVDNVVAFYAANGQTVAKNRAYLQTTTSQARISLDFDDIATGISNTESGKPTTEGFFNLAGQRVAQPTKGLYIVNGKKVIIK